MSNARLPETELQKFYEFHKPWDVPLRVYVRVNDNYDSSIAAVYGHFSSSFS